MTERKFKKLMEDKPYLMDGMFQRSKAEAQRLALASELTIEQVILSARQRSDMPEQAWTRVDRALLQKDGARHARSGRTDLWKRAWNRAGVRRLAAAALALLLIVAFFALIPGGRTLARSAYSYFANAFENRIQIGPESQLPQQNRGAETGVISVAGDETGGDVVVRYGSLADFAADYGLTPVRFVSDRFVCAGITLTKYESSGISLSSQYISEEGSIFIVQKWLVSDSMNAYGGGDGWQSAQILGDTELHYMIDPKDGVFDGFAVLGDSVVWITAEASVDMSAELPNLTE